MHQYLENNLKRKRELDGFTLIELLVVIAIISLLSSVVLASLSSARERAKVTRMASDFKQIETAMMLWMQSTGQVQWPVYGAEKDIANWAETSSLGSYLNSVPEPPFGTTSYRYDYDGDFGNCSGAGVAILVQNVPQEIMGEIDKMMDGGNGLDCGQISKNPNNWFYYRLSSDGNL